MTFSTQQYRTYRKQDQNNLQTDHLNHIEGERSITNKLLLIYYSIKQSINIHKAYMYTSSFLLLIALLALIYFLYFWIIKPYKLYTHYKKILQKDYKTYVLPFNPFSSALLRRFKQDVQMYRDSQYTIKFIYSDYQLVLSTFRDAAFLRLIDPQLIRQFFQKSNQGYYRKTQKSPFTAGIKIVIGNGLILSEGQQWKNKRKIMTTVFNYDFIKSKIGTISAITKEVLDKIESQASNESKKVVKMDLDLTLQQIFGNVVIKCFFGNICLKDIEGEPLFNFYRTMAEKNTERALTPFAFIVGPRFINLNLRQIDRQADKMCRTFNKYAEDTIQNYVKSHKLGLQQAKTKKESNGVIDLLLSQDKLKDESNQSEPKDYYTTQDLIDEFKTFLFAGTDTTANTTAVLIYQLAKNKDIQQKLRQQIRDIIGEDLQNITFDKLKEMKYLQKCFKEILRMHSAVPGLFSRQALKDHYLGKIPIKKGMVIVVSMLTNHHKQEFAKKPQIFNPDRWDDIDLKKKDPYLYFPFSSGQRNCIGQHLAAIQSKIAVIHLLVRYSKIILQKQEIKYLLKVTYGAERMTTTFVK